MKIGIFTSGYQRNKIEDIFEDAQKFGYDYVELWGGRPHAYPYDLKNGDIDIILKLIEKYDMPVYCYTPEHNAYPYNFMIGPERQRQESVDYLKTAMDMGKELGAEYVLFSAGHGGYFATGEELWTRLIKSVGELAEHGEKIGQKLILEQLTAFESNVCTSANDVLNVLNAVQSSCLYGMCDIVPPFIHAESILSYFDKLGDRLAHLHVVDSDGKSDTHVLPGEGVLPLPELLQEIKERGYGGTMTIELVTAYINEPRLYARRAINNLRKMLAD